MAASARLRDDCATNLFHEVAVATLQLIDLLLLLLPEVDDQRGPRLLCIHDFPFLLGAFDVDVFDSHERLSNHDE
jgi:hypothetical protein